MSIIEIKIKICNRIVYKTINKTIKKNMESFIN